MNSISIFKNRILWKIYLIWFFRRILPLIIIEIAVVIMALKIFAKNVFVGKVLENAALASESNWWEFIKYLASSFSQTHPIVQVTIIAILGLGALFLRDIGRTIITYAGTFKKRIIEG